MSVYGIDLGTTYSCIAKLDANGNPVIIHNNNDDSDTLASALYFENGHHVIIGENAKEYVETDGENVVQFIKREIGKDYPPHVIHGNSYTPTVLSAYILKRLKEMAEEQGESVKDVVITIPAYFGFKERNQTLHAGEIAGLNVMNLINEPTAAALSYCFRLYQENMNVLVYDLGGGTFDVSIVHMALDNNRQMEIIATGGNDMLGGKDWDEHLYAIICERVIEETGMDIYDLDSEEIQSIRSKIEVVKKKLSTALKADIRLRIQGQRLTITITRQEFEDATKALVDQTMTYVENTLDKVKNIKIDKVLLVGGSTYMQMIKNAVEKRFPGIVQQEDPNRAVAKGAAIYAHMMKQEELAKNNHMSVNADLVVHDVSPRSFGIGVTFPEGYLIDNIVKEGQEMNKVYTRKYRTVYDNQRGMFFQVYENRSLDDRTTPCCYNDANGKNVDVYTDPALEVKKLGEFTMELNGKDPKGTYVLCEFTVKASGIYITVTSLTDKNYTTDAFITYDNSYNSDEVQTLQKEVAGVTLMSE
ncbi:MAG: Hsp70 family protein [Erysipelotrichaceae bacterium]|nr:Hsp70 family protein [Erysipelotrichaceae bacterium]